MVLSRSSLQASICNHCSDHRPYLHRSLVTSIPYFPAEYIASGKHRRIINTIFQQKPAFCLPECWLQQLTRSPCPPETWFRADLVRSNLSFAFGLFHSPYSFPFGIHPRKVCENWRWKLDRVVLCAILNAIYQLLNQGNFLFLPLTHTQPTPFDTSIEIPSAINQLNRY